MVLIVRLTFAILLTGLVMALGTKWGVFSLYWILFSPLLILFATIYLLSETRAMSYFAARAADPATSSADLRALGSTLSHSVSGALVLLVNMWQNMYKPRGQTPYRWRTQHEQRKLSQL